MSPTYTLQAPCSQDPALLAELYSESFTSLDRARDIALSFVEEYRTDIAILRHFGAASCVWEEYDSASYGAVQ
jgi:hypothetical protein